MSSIAIFRLYLLNVGISLAAAVWIFRDAKARCLRSYRYQPLFIFLAGLAGLWLPYILYYLLFRTPGKLVRCPANKHWMSEVLPKCPSCNPSMLMSERQLEKHLESWKITQKINDFLDKLPAADTAAKELETGLWFDRLSHYQKSYLYYLSINGVMLILLSIFVSLIIFSPLLRLELVPLVAVIILLILFSFSSISVYQILRRIQSEIEMVKIILTTFVGERGEFFRSKSGDIFSSLSAWGMQVSSALMATITFLLVFAHFESHSLILARLAENQPFLMAFFKLLIAGVLLAAYLGVVMKIKDRMDLEQTRELHGLLEKLAGKKPAAPKKVASASKITHRKSTKK